jgi:two-component system, NtrC family, nitrogen regulation response regulator GlnG
MAITDEVNKLSDLFIKEHSGKVYRNLIESVEKPLIEKILAMTLCNQLKTARILGINRNTLRTKMRKLGIRC